MKGKGNNKLKIEKGIPVPLRNRSSSAYAQVLRKMQVGDSVLIPDVPANTVRMACMRVFGTGRYACRKVEGGVRVWRTA